MSAFMLRCFAAFSLVGLGAGCSGSAGGPQAGGQTGGETVGCLPVTTRVLPLAEPSVLGFSGADVLSLAGGDHTATLVWTKGGSTELTLSVSSTATQARYEDREWKDDGSGMEVAMGCLDVVAVEVTVGFKTADGAFDESWTTELTATSATEASLYRELDLAALGGSYQVTEVNPADYDALRVFLDADFAPRTVHGTLSGQAIQNGDSSNPDSTASAMLFQVATF